MIGLSRRRMMGSQKSYTFVNYIVNSNQNSRIITNCAPLNDNNYTFELDCYVEERDTSRPYGMLFTTLNGTDASNKKWKIAFLNSDNQLFALSNSNTNASIILIYNGLNGFTKKRLFLILTSSQLKEQNLNIVTNQHGSKGGTYISDNYIYLNEKTTNAPIIRYYAMNVYYNNNLIHQYKPCITSNGIYTMVDVLNNYICEVDGNAWSGN